MNLGKMYLILLWLAFSWHGASALNNLPDSLKGEWMQAGFLRFHESDITVVKVINVLNYGASNDNTNSSDQNLDALQGALSDLDTSGYTLIYFPYGQYRFNNAVSLDDYQNVILVGSGSDQTQLIFDLNNQEGLASIQVNNCNRLGIENIYITREDEATLGINFAFRDFSRNCWLSGVESYKAASEHINLAYCNNIDILGCYVHHAWNYGAGGKGYGVTLYRDAVKCLVENNIFEHLRHSVIFGSKSHDNVIGYNYSTDPYTTEVWFGIDDWPGDLVLHGASDGLNEPPYNNLFEGNTVAFMIADNAWGPNGPNNAFLRNRATYYGIKIDVNSPFQSVIANELDDSEGDVHTYFDWIWNAYDIQSSNNFVVGNTNFDPDPPDFPQSVDYSNDLTLYLDITMLPQFLETLDYWPAIGVVDEEHLGGGSYPAEERWNEGIKQTVERNYGLLTNVIYDQKDDGLRIYPNPTFGKFILSIEGIESSSITIEIFNVFGDLVRLETIEIDSGINQISLDITNVTSGVYFLTVYNKGIIAERKIIKK